MLSADIIEVIRECTYNDRLHNRIGYIAIYSKDVVLRPAGVNRRDFNQYLLHYNSHNLLILPDLNTGYQSNIPVNILVYQAEYVWATMSAEFIKNRHPNVVTMHSVFPELKETIHENH